MKVMQHNTIHQSHLRKYLTFALQTVAVAFLLLISSRVNAEDEILTPQTIDIIPPTIQAETNLVPIPQNPDRSISSVTGSTALQEAQPGVYVKRFRRSNYGAPGRNGYMGLFRGLTGDQKPRNSFRFGTMIGVYSAPAVWDNTTQDHLEAISFVDYTLWPFLDVGFTISGIGHQSGYIFRVDQDTLFQSMGDMHLYGRYTRRILPYLSVAGLADLSFYTRTNDLFIEWPATSFSLLAGVTLELEKLPQSPLQLPMRVHFTTGYMLDRSISILDQASFPTATAMGAYSLGLGDRIPFYLGFEIIDEPVSYFFEYSFEPYVYYRADSNLLNARPSIGASPHRLTAGIRWNIANRLLLNAAFDYSYGIQQEAQIFGSSEPTGPPYTAYLGLSYEFQGDAWRVLDYRYEVTGIVFDADTGDPLGGVRIEYLNSAQFSTQLSDAKDGSFASYKLPPGDHIMMFQRDGYEPIVIQPKAEPLEVLYEEISMKRISLESESVGAIVGNVVNERREPIAATIEFEDARQETIYTAGDDNEFLRLLPEGTYNILVSADGYRAKQYRVPVLERKKTRILFQLDSGDQRGLFSGIVVGEDRNPIPATIFFLNQNIDLIETDRTGGFEQYLEPGTYQIEVRAVGHVAQRYELPIESKKNTILEIVLQKEQDVGAIAGRIITVDGLPLAGIISFPEQAINPIYADPDTGDFERVLDAGEYEIKVEASGYDARRFRVPILRGKKTVQEFRLRPIDNTNIENDLLKIIDDEIVLSRPIQFEPGTAILMRDAYVFLEEVAKVVLNLPAGQKVSIQTHTHGLGEASANLRLSTTRAEAIQDYLSNLGVPIERLEIDPRGETQPIAPNSTIEGRQTNERVQLFFVKN